MELRIANLNNDDIVQDMLKKRYVDAYLFAIWSEYKGDEVKARLYRPRVIPRNLSFVWPVTGEECDVIKDGKIAPGHYSIKLLRGTVRPADRLFSSDKLIVEGDAEEGRIVFKWEEKQDG